MNEPDVSQQLEPQMAAVLALQVERAKQFQASAALVCDMPVAEARALYARERRFWNEEAPAVAAVEERRITGPYGEIPLRCYRPVQEGSLPVLLFLHGGGFILGNLDTHDRVMRSLALRSGFAVVGVDYRLAPEHKLPVQLEECLAAIAFLAEQGRDWGLDTDRMAVAGDSAGAHLSLGCCLALRDAGSSPIGAGLLYYGAFGLDDSVSRRCYGGAEDGMDPRDLAYYRACLLNHPGEKEDPRYDLLRNDLSGLPPPFIAAAQCDPVHDDSLALAALLDRVGVPNRMVVYDGVLHGFLHYGRMLDKANAAVEAGAAFLTRHLC